MNGFVARALAVACVTGGLAASGCGPCIPVRDQWDRCWPQRYNYVARKELVEAFAPQVQNGHILDQTVWNYHFETGSDKLTPGGMQKLDTLSRTRPQPDQYLFLATAHDIHMDPEKPEGYAEERQRLDAKRVAAIQRYLNTQMAGRPMAFEVLIHDPYEVGLAADTAAGAVRRMRMGISSLGVGGGISAGGAGNFSGGAGNVTGAGGTGSGSTYIGGGVSYQPGAPGAGAPGMTTTAPQR